MQTRTTTQMIEGLRDPGNADAWSAFDARYRRILVGFARRLGLGSEDSVDLAQQTLAEFSAAYRQGRYDRAKGRLSSWLIGIARNLAMEMRRRARVRQAAGGSAADEVAAPEAEGEHLSRVWAKEREAAILGEALAVLRASPRMEAHTMRAFELFALQGVPAEQVAAQCGMAVDTVYVVKNRLTKRLREIVRDLTTAYDDGGDA